MKAATCHLSTLRFQEGPTAALPAMRQISGSSRGSACPRVRGRPRAEEASTAPARPPSPRKRGRGLPTPSIHATVPSPALLPAPARALGQAIVRAGAAPTIRARIVGGWRSLRLERARLEHERKRVAGQVPRVTIRLLRVACRARQVHADRLLGMDAEDFLPAVAYVLSAPVRRDVPERSVRAEREVDGAVGPDPPAQGPLHVDLKRFLRSASLGAQRRSLWCGNWKADSLTLVRRQLEMPALSLSARRLVHQPEVVRDLPPGQGRVFRQPGGQLDGEIARAEPVGPRPSAKSSSARSPSRSVIDCGVGLRRAAVRSRHASAVPT